MFGLPSWALGVIAIITVAGGVQMIGMVVRSVLGLPQREGREGKRRGQTVIGVSLPGTESGEQAGVIDDLQRRVADLEERLDFAERLLAQQRDHAQLNPPDK